jgi:threonine synthase
MDYSEFKYVCAECGREFDIAPGLMLCPGCREENLEGKPLRGVLSVKLPKSLINSKKKYDDFDLFDYLPVEREYFPEIPVGNTLLCSSSNLNRELKFENIFLKFDGTNPSGSYKDRASYLVSAFAKKQGVEKIVVASTGNAASSMACIAASAAQEAVIFMPGTAPKAKLVQCIQYGARVIPINGNYDMAFDLSLKFSEKTGFLNRNTAYNPMTIEGKKTAAFELVKQLSPKQIDYVFVPAGDGVILSGIIKGFKDLKDVGLIDSVPEIIGAQSSGSAFIYNAFHKGIYDLKYKADTRADSISVDAARNGYSVVKDLKSVGGNVVTASDDEIFWAQHYLSKKTGIFCEPSSAVAFACFYKIMDRIPKDKTIALLLTGHGLKDINGAMNIIEFPKFYEPDIDVIMREF